MKPVITICRDTSMNALSDTGNPDDGAIVEQHFDAFMDVLRQRAEHDGIVIEESDNGGFGPSYHVEDTRAFHADDLHQWVSDNADFWHWYN